MFLRLPLLSKILGVVVIVPAVVFLVHAGLRRSTSETLCLCPPNATLPKQTPQNKPNKSDLVLVYTSNNTALELQMQRQFRDVYKYRKWGKYEGAGFSGPGSHPQTTRDYQKFLGQFVKDHQIETVLDIPCGLWTFSQYVDWGSIKKYTGLDIVEMVVAANQKRYGDERFSFGIGSLTAPNLPPADVLICKDALQHLPLRVTERFLNYSLATTPTSGGGKRCKYRYMLITNDRMNPMNKDLNPGQNAAGRDLTLPPFNKKATTVFRFSKHPVKMTQLFNLSDPFYGCTEFLTA